MLTYVLNLKTSVKRLADFTAAYPETLPAFKVWEARPPEKCSPPAWWRGSGPFWSHTENFKEVLRFCQQRNETMLFFEDDCVFAPDFKERYEEFLAEVPDDWEVLNLCVNNTASILRPPKRISENVIKPALGFNTNAMLIRPEGARKMRLQLEKESWPCKHIAEQILGYLYSDETFKGYAPFQNFIGQADCWSELCQKMRGERWYNTFTFRDLDGKLKLAPGRYEQRKETP
ncbi:MAG: hypothetical protein IJF17_00885 [Thermoguttaceae bacterium]|nr:hypothetical protein [Thermoguttaceae bacterium]